MVQCLQMYSQIDFLKWFNFLAISVFMCAVHTMTNAAGVKINERHTTTTSGGNSVIY